MTLTDDQEEVCNGAIHAIRNEGETKILITGSAGTGKTTLVNALMHRLNAAGGYATLVSAPTHKALWVLRTKTKVTSWIKFATIHSALKLKRFFKDGKQVFRYMFEGRRNVPHELLPFFDIDIVVIDETSMLEKYLIDLIEQNHPNVIFIFIGDRKQLPPVGEKISPVFTKNWRTFDLTKIIRQGVGNPIIDLSRDLNRLYSRQDNLVEINGTLSGYLFTSDWDYIIQQLAIVNGTDDLKYLAYTNKVVDSVNNAVRRLIYGANPNKIQLGETLIMNSPWGEYHTNKEIKVTSLEVVERTLFIPNEDSKIHETDNGLILANPYEYRGEEQVMNPDGTPKMNCGVLKVKVYLINESMPVIHEHSEREFKTIYGEIEAKCNARIHNVTFKHYFIEQVADVGYNHALTVHKSQGSTYKKVVMNFPNILTNRSATEREKMLYTAVTRPANLLIVHV